MWEALDIVRYKTALFRSSPRVQKKRCSRELSDYFINSVYGKQMVFLQRSVTLKIDTKRA